MKDLSVMLIVLHSKELELTFSLTRRINYQSSVKEQFHDFIEIFQGKCFNVRSRAYFVLLNLTYC